MSEPLDLEEVEAWFKPELSDWPEAEERFNAIVAALRGTHKVLEQIITDYYDYIEGAGHHARELVKQARVELAKVSDDANKNS